MKALSYASRVLIMDEPTAALTTGEVERLFGIIRRLAATGVGIVYISHRLEEVPQIADRVTVMRDGRVAGTTAADAPQGELVRMLVGRPLDELYPPRAKPGGALRLRLADASFEPVRPRAGWQAPREISLDVHAGEIVGLAGMMGAGRTELLSALFGTGAQGRWRGTVEIDGRPADLSSIRAARRAGVAFVTDDRRGSGLMLRMSAGAQPGDVGAAADLAGRPDVGGARGRRGGTLAQPVRYPAEEPGDRRRRAVRAAISRRWCSPRRSSTSRRCCCSTSRRAASMSAPRARSMRGCASSRRRASASWSPRARCRS